MAARPCDECLRWMYDADGKPTMHGDRRIPRLAGMPTPCGSCPKIPPGERVLPWARSPCVGRRHEATARTRAILHHYEECRAVGQFPDDALVRRHAAILHQIDRAHEQAQGRQQTELMLTALGLTRLGGGATR